MESGYTMTEGLIASISTLILLVYSLFVTYKKNRAEQKLKEKERELQDVKSKELQEKSDSLGRKYRNLLDSYRGNGPEGNA